VVPTSTTIPPTTTTAAGGCAVPPRAKPDPNRPHYVLRVDVRPKEHRALGDVTVRFTPDVPVDRLVFRLWPNGPRGAASGAVLTASNVEVGAHPARAERPDPTTLVVPLGGMRPAGQQLEASMSWELALPRPNNDRVAQIGDAVRLGSFFPILAWEPGVGWSTDPPAPGFAEASTAPTADFDASVSVPAGLDVLASGVADANRTRWHVEAARDFALSVGHFRMAEAQAEGVRVTVGVDAAVTDSADAYASKIADKITVLTRLFGPFPWPVYTVAVTPQLSGGIEYPMHVMQGPNTIGRTTTHELAHQWFYALVGNNQGRDPWLDEGLATYAEGRGENSLPSILATAVPLDARGRVTQPMTYWSAHQPSYYRGVYVQGAQAVASLGPVDRVDCALRIYVAANAYRIARPADLVEAMAAVFADTTKLATFGVTSSP
ncbi:MAG: hypothetical protein H0W70_16135, partial [Actinobacteria bacterium]|nr:hypothetical protein [Actinomycetota bacterium]